jgi:hypothetical protein
MALPGSGHLAAPRRRPADLQHRPPRPTRRWHHCTTACP